MTLEDLKKIQNIGSEILFDVVRICEKHHIEYFLLYGTLLGAVRHNGPIPWDDDVDIGMTRENYIRFLHIAPEELDPRNTLTIMGCSEQPYLSMTKIGRSNAVCYLPGTRDLNIMHQIQIDIFPLDYIKNFSPQKAKFITLLRRCLMYAKLNWDEKKLIFHLSKDSQRRRKYIYTIGLTALHSMRMIFGEKLLEQWIYRLLVDKSHTSGQIGLALDSGPLVLIPEEHFVSSVDHLYDEKLLKIPVGYHEVLKHFYGNYMECPPETERYRKRFEQYVVEIDD